MEMPEVSRCFGIFPVKYATYLISLFGLGSGGVILAGIVLYGIAETAKNAVVASNISEDVKKATLVSLGLTSILLLVGNAFLLIGASTKMAGAVNAGVRVLFALCVILLFGAISAPMACFFLDSSCLVKKVSSITITLGILSVTGFLELWIYFIAVAWNYGNQL